MIWLLTILSLVGVVLNIYKKRICFIIWAFTNACWCIIDLKHNLPEQACLFLVYFLLAIWGNIKWGK
jgi:hypothetical protein